MGRSPKARCWLGHMHSRGSRGESFLASSNVQWLQHCLVGGHRNPVSASISTWLLPCVSVSFPLRLPVTGFRGFPGVSVIKNSSANAGDTGDACSIRGSGRSPGEGNGNPLQYSCLKMTPWTVGHRFLCLCNSPGQNTEVGSHFSLQDIFPNQRSEPRAPALQADSLPSGPSRKPS